VDWSIDTKHCGLEQCNGSPALDTELQGQQGRGWVVFLPGCIWHWRDGWEENGQHKFWWGCRPWGVGTWRWICLRKDTWRLGCPALARGRPERHMVNGRPCPCAGQTRAPPGAWAALMHGVDPSSTWRLGLGKKPDWLWQPQRHVALGFVRGVGAAWLTQVPNGHRVWLQGKDRLAPRGWTRPLPTWGWADASTLNLGLGLDGPCPTPSWVWTRPRPTSCVNIIMCYKYYFFSYNSKYSYKKYYYLCCKHPWNS